MLKKIIFILVVICNYTFAQINSPNILIFIADDAGMDFGSYGNDGAKTPNIDKLADGGLKCMNAFLTAPQCSPSRTSILSGQFAHTIGTEDLHSPIDSETKLIPHYLGNKGYYTGIMLKTHLGDNGVKQFNWNDQFLRSTQKTWWDKNIRNNFGVFLDSAETKPFFMWCAFNDPHRPYSDHPDQREIAPHVNDPSKVFVPPYLVDDEATRQDLSEYYDEISRMDGHVGEMIKELEVRGLRENTIIIFLSDNGMPFPRAKGTLYDSGIQTPLIFNWPTKVNSESKFEGLVSVIDLAPTVLEIAGIDKPSQMYGSSIQNILYDQTVPGRNIIFAERNWHDADEYMRSLRTNEYSLIYNAYNYLPHGTAIDLSTSPSWYSLKNSQRNGSITDAQKFIFLNPRFKLEMYDVINDKYQLNNLTGKREYLVKSQELARLLFSWMKETKDHTPDKRKQHDIVDRTSGFPLSFEEIRDFMGGQYNK